MLRINIITFVLIALWFVAAMTAPMMFANPSPEDYSFLAKSVSALFLFPILVAIVYMIKKWSFFGFHPFLFGPTLIAFSLVGYFGVGVFNFSYMVWKGVDPYGYTVRDSLVLYQGTPLKDVDAGSFQVQAEYLENGQLRFDARDKNREYLWGKALDQKK